MARTSDMKQKIIDCALRLFNENGYDRVSLREIADAAGTSIGNLTYHFSHKEDLLAEIQDIFHSNLDEILIDTTGQDDLLSCLYQSFQHAQARQLSNPFYYHHILDLSKDSKTVSESNERFRKQLYDYYRELLFKLRDCGIMRQDVPERVYETLSYSIVVSMTVWTHKHSPYYDADLPRMELASALGDMVYPYLSPSQNGSPVK